VVGGCETGRTGTSVNCCIGVTADGAAFGAQRHQIVLAVRQPWNHVRAWYRAGCMCRGSLDPAIALQPLERAAGTQPTWRHDAFPPLHVGFPRHDNIGDFS